MTYRVAVAASGRGSNLEALLRRLDGNTAVQVVVVLSNKRDAGAICTAQAAGIGTAVLGDPSDPGAWLAALQAHEADLLVLAGYLKLVPPAVIEAWRGRILNIHPALLPAHGGPGMYGRRVHEAVLAAGDRESGATVHLVTEEYDRGPVLAQARLAVNPGETAESLAARVLELEHQLLPDAVLVAAESGAPRAFAFEERTSWT